LLLGYIKFYFDLRLRKHRRQYVSNDIFKNMSKIICFAAVSLTSICFLTIRYQTIRYVAAFLWLYVFKPYVLNNIS
ncbi:MAG: hypothetical protein RR405_03865, partial [Clostridia bacterium]